MIIWGTLFGEYVSVAGGGVGLLRGKIAVYASMSRVFMPFLHQAPYALKTGIFKKLSKNLGLKSKMPKLT